MKKYDVFGTEVVTVKELRFIIRQLRKAIPRNYHNFDEKQQSMVHLAYNDIVRQLYLDELKKAKTPEEIEAILEMPGDFMVARSNVNDEHKRRFEAFAGFENGEPTYTDKAFKAIIFNYESKAKEIAEMLGEGWEVYDMSREAHEMYQRLLTAIFDDNEDNEEEKK